MLNKRGIAFLVAVMVIQIVTIVYWGEKRENYYWDEYYTFEKAHYISHSTPVEHPITEDETYRENEWLPISLVKDTLVVTRDNSILNDRFKYVLMRLTSYNNYAVYLNVFETILSPGELSLWPAIVLNIVLFVIIQILLCNMAYSLTNSKAASIITVAFYGFSSMCISMSVFVRFYVLATLFTVLFVFFHYKYWTCEIRERVKKILFIVLAFASLYLGYCNAPYTIIFGAFFVISFTIGLFVFKGWRSFAAYALPIYGGGIWYLATKTDYLGIFFDFEGTYNRANGAMQWAMEQIMEFTPHVLPERLDEMGKLMGRYLFGSYFVMLFFIMLLIIASIIKLVKNEKNIINEKGNQIVIITSSSLALFLILFTAFRLYDQPRYISYIFPVLALVVIYAAYYMFRQKKMSILLMIALVIIQMFAVNYKSKVDMLYLGDRSAIQSVREIDADKIMLHAGKGAQATHMVYEATLFVDDDAKFFSYNCKDLDKAREALCDGMLIVFENGTEHPEFDDMINKSGYNIKDIAWTYKFAVKQIYKE